MLTDHLEEYRQLAYEAESAAARASEAHIKAQFLEIETALRGLEESSLAEAMRKQKAYLAFAARRTSEDNQEGGRAFAEKQPPAWKGG